MAPVSPDEWPGLVVLLDGGFSRAEIERAYGPEAGRWAEGQCDLRRRAKTKFGAAAERMLLTREGLEQATPLPLARYHASRFPSGAPVTDLTVGLGADLLALAERGPACGFELDPERVRYARHNLAALERDAEIVIGDALASEPTEFAWADPSRRIEGRRLTDPEEGAPPLSVLAARARGRLGIKLSPLTSDSLLARYGGALEFVSFGGECREALLWLGDEPEPGRWAVLVGEYAEIARLPAGGAPSIADRPGEWLYDADPAAIRAHALGGFGLKALGDSPGYLTGSEVESPWLRRYRIFASGSFDPKRVRADLRTHRRSVFEVKRRGVADEADARARALIAATDGEPASLVLYSVGRSVRYLLAESD